MQDSAYSNSKIPLWVFETGILFWIYYIYIVLHLDIRFDGHLFGFIFSAVSECWVNWNTGVETVQVNLI